MSGSITVTLPDGSLQSVPVGTKPIEVAQSISPRLADDAVVARVDGELYDLTRPLDHDATLQVLTSKNPEALQVYRHSTAHLLAAAVLELFPETKLGIGPPTETGFYYDFQRETPFVPIEQQRLGFSQFSLSQQAGAKVALHSGYPPIVSEFLALDLREALLINCLGLSKPSFSAELECQF